MTSNVSRNVSILRRLTVLLLALAVFGALQACEGGGDETGEGGPVEPPPLETEVILDDDSPPRPGCELLFLHAFSECRGGVWHVVTRGSYSCGGSQTVKDVHVIRTNQPCEAADRQPDPLSLSGLALEPPSGCSSPVVLRRFHVVACPQGSTWDWLAHDLVQCADGRSYIVRVHAEDVITNTPCDAPAPSIPG